MPNDQQSPLTVELNITGLPDAAALDQIGLLIDASHDAQSKAGTDRAFVLLDELQKRNLAPDTAVLAHYFRANAWENKRRARKDDHIWAWEQPEQQEQILELRRAVTHAGFAELHPIRQCQILTNLANQLNTIGRFIEAIEIWDRALTLNGKFGMARGNRGYGLSHYARALYDPGHVRFMLTAAYDGFMAAVADDAFYESPDYQTVRAAFSREAQNIAARVDTATIRQHVTSRRHHRLGKSPGEKRYRTWCLHNRLFINPLNDLGPLPIAAHDVLTLPSITESSPYPRPPAVIGFFNQMKQEFVSARYLYYEGANAKGVHFSDRGVLLYNTLDYPAYSLATEKMRAAFRLAYSLFDKIGFFLNEYFSLGHNPWAVSFRSVWYEAKGSPRPLLQRFANCQNWPLCGLFWLSKDLFEDDFKRVTQPDAANLNDIRNHLEHKYLQLHQEGLGAIALMDGPADDKAGDQLGYALTTDEFALKTLRLLKLVRAALIYLSLAVHREETLRVKAKDDGRIIFPMLLHPWRDDWKR